MNQETRCLSNAPRNFVLGNWLREKQCNEEGKQYSNRITIFNEVHRERLCEVMFELRIKGVRKPGIHMQGKNIPDTEKN